MTTSEQGFASRVPLDRRSGRGWASLQRNVWQAIWFVVAPAVLTALCLRFLVPTPAEGRSGFAAVIARLGSQQPVPLTVGLFLLFAMLLRYWRFYLPGSRQLAGAEVTAPMSLSREDLPEWRALADLRLALREKRTSKRLTRTLSPGLHLTFESALRVFDGALAAGDIPSAVRAARTVRGLSAPALRARERRQTALAIGTAAIAGLLALFLRGQVVTPCRVLSASMLPTLSPGDLIAENRLTYRSLPTSVGAGAAPLPQRGDIVVFRQPGLDESSPPLIKRVIGLPGDRIGMHGSRATINGWEVPACDAGVYLYPLSDGAIKARLLVEFLEHRAYLTIAAPPAREFPEPYDVKPGEVFVLGDNRNNSSDSRAWNDGHGGGLPLEQIDGRARWFLLATRRDQHFDASRLLAAIGGTELHVEALDTSSLREEIANCLRDWPRETFPPPPGSAPPADSLSPAPPARVSGE
jgi:signal peptidase I